MDSFNTYDKTDPKSIESYAKNLIGHTFLDVLRWSAQKNSGAGSVHEAEFAYGNKQRKGGLGNLLEEKYFEYKANSESAPDFPEAGVELKATPYEVKKDGSLRAGERLVLTMINFGIPVVYDFYKSHFWEKCKLLLLIYYHRDKSLKSNLQYPINYVQLFTPPEPDLEIIMNDYRVIVEKIAAGKAHELSEGDTMYLGACTKGATAEKSITKQYYNPDVPAKTRAFCYKTSYMNYILNNYMIPGVETYEPIIKDANQLAGQTFEEYIINQINQYAGKTDYELCQMFDREYNNNKAQWFELAHRMLGIKSNKAEEFVKANIVVKAIRIEENGTMRESSPLPPISFIELVEEEWEDSVLYDYFSETKFLFVVYKKQGEHYVLKGAQLWNMSYDDLNETVYKGWEDIRQIVSDGIIFDLQETKTGVVVKNNLPPKSHNPIIHMRPHASKRFYVFEDGKTLGDGSYADAEQLPDGRWMTKQSFWLNNTYILSQLDDKLK